MADVHRHFDLEMNLLEGGEGAVYQSRAGKLFGIEPRRFFVFLAFHPHRLQAPPGAVLRMHWAVAPVGWLLRHDLPADLLRRILSGEPVVSPQAHEADSKLFASWIEDTRSGNPHRVAAARLEMEARVRRLWAEQPESQLSPSRKRADSSSVLRLAEFLIENYREKVSARDAAKAAGLTLGYASECFSKTFGFTMTEFLASLRLGESARLLLQTDRTVLDLALSSGFQTPSLFYQQFRRFYGMSPGAFRDQREYHPRQTRNP